MSAASAQLGLQLDPVISAVLDKRCYGTALNRPAALVSGPGLLRYEEKADSSAAYDDWPKWVFFNESQQWVDLGTVGPAGPSGPAGADAVDFDPSTAPANSIVRNAIGAVSEGTTIGALESLTISNLLAQILDLGPEVGIMPIATGVGAVYTVAPVDPQIGTNYIFSGQVQFNRGSYSPPETSGDAFPAGNAINVTMSDPIDTAAIAFTTGGTNIFNFSKAHTIPLTLASYTVNGTVAHQAGGEALNNIGDVITTTLPSTSVSLPTLNLRSFAPVLRETVTIASNGSLSYGTPVESFPASKGSGLSSTQRFYGDTAQVVVTDYNFLQTFLVLTSKFKSDAVLEIYDPVFGWQTQTPDTWTFQNINVGTANIPYTRIRVPTLQLGLDVRMEMNVV